MKKSMLIIILALIVFSLLVGCEAKEKEPKVYKVTKSTGLYSSINPDAEMIRSLSVGYAVIPESEDGKLFCLTNAEDMELCKVRVVGSDDVGWVLIKWFEED